MVNTAKPRDCISNGPVLPRNLGKSIISDVSHRVKQKRASASLVRQISCNFIFKCICNLWHVICVENLKINLSGHINRQQW